MGVRSSERLSPMALKAINYFMRGYPKVESMRMAGYAEASATGHSKKFWQSKAVQAEIRERKRKLAVKSEISLKKTMDFLASLLDLTPGDLIGPDGKVLKWEEIPKDIAKLLNFRVTSRGVVVESIDKIRVIELMSKLAGWAQETISIRLDGDLHTKIALARKQLALTEDLPRLEAGVASPATHSEVIDVRADLVSEGPDGEIGAEGPEEAGEWAGPVGSRDEATLGETEAD